MKHFFRLSRAALASFFLLFIVQIFSSCNCPKHSEKGKTKTLYGCIAAEYQEKNANHK